jgi:hypothetical protein
MTKYVNTKSKTTIRCSGCGQVFEGHNPYLIVNEWHRHYVECVKK